MTSAPDQIPHPRRLLILTPTTHSPSLIPPFLHSLTGTPVSAASPNDPGDSPAESADGNAKGGRGGGFAGYTTHPPLALKNRYYSAEVPVWVDEIPIPVHPGNAQQRGTESAGVNHPDSKNTHTHTDTEKNEGKAAAAAEWKTEFSSPEARVVRDALGAVVICLPNPSPSSSGTAGLEQEGHDYADRDDVRVLTDFVRNVAAVIRLIEEEREDESGGGGGDVLGLVVLVGSSTTPAPTAPSMSAAEDLNISEADAEAEEEPFSPAWWEDRFFDLGITGLEVVSWDPKRHDSAEKNKFGELQGMRRIKEVLETHDWTGPGPDGDEELEKELLEMDSEDGFNLEVDELEREMVGLRMAIERGGDADDGDGADVDNMEALMSKVQAIKDMSAEMPDHERRKFAAKAVSDIMKEI